MAVNAALREHVTSVGFSLTLTKSQLRGLVFLALCHSGRINDSYYPDHGERGWYVTAAKGLIVRGLVEHVYPPRWFKGSESEWKNRDTHKGRPITPADFYLLTQAGDLVVQLLAQAGLFTDIADTFRSRLKAVS